MTRVASHDAQDAPCCAACAAWDRATTDACFDAHEGTQRAHDRARFALRDPALRRVYRNAYWTQRRALRASLPEGR